MPPPNHHRREYGRGFLWSSCIFPAPSCPTYSAVKDRFSIPLFCSAGWLSRRSGHWLCTLHACSLLVPTSWKRSQWSRSGASEILWNPINNLIGSIIYLYQICIKCVYCSFDVSNCTDFSFESLNNLATMQLRLGFRPQLEEVLLNVS